MGALSALIPSAEQAAVRDRTARLHRDPALGTWVRQGLLPPQVSRRVCFVVAAIAPDLPHERLTLLVRYALWSILLDDQLDGPDPQPGALGDLRDAVAGALAGHPGYRPQPLITELDGIVAELSRYDRGDGGRPGPLLARFGAAVRDAVAGGVAHALLSRAVIDGEAPPPTAEEYLTVAARTVNYHSFAYALLLLGPTRLTDPMLDQLAPALRSAAQALRLANDLRSVARDRVDATLNILNLRTSAGVPVTAGEVQHRIARLTRAHDRALRHLVDHDDVTGPAARALRRSLRLSIGLYQLADLR